MATNAVIPMVYKVDWFQATESDVLGELLPLSQSKFWKFLQKIGYKYDDFEETSPRYFYNSGLTLGRYLNIYYDTENKGINKYSPKNVMFQFTGQGSTDLALKLSDYFKTNNFELVWHKFFDIIYKWLKVTRMDVALDDYNGLLSFDKMERKLKRKEFRSSKQRYQVLKDKKADGSNRGETIYLGTRKRHQDGYLIRFYDKYAEYKTKGAILPTEVENIVTGTGTHIWQRYEMEFHGKACGNFVEQILQGLTFGYLYKGLMRNAIEFLKVSKSNKNKSYWSVVDWWEDFLDGAGKCSVSTPERDIDLGRLLRWIKVAVAPSLHLLDDIGQVKGFDIYEMIKDCDVGEYAKKQERLKNETIAMPDKLLALYLQKFKDGDY